MSSLSLSVRAARKLQRELVEQGECKTMDDAAHYLVDMGEIDTYTHAQILSKAERARLYPDPEIGMKC